MFGDEMIDEASHKMARAIVARGRAAPATTGPAMRAADETTASHECRNKNGTG